MSSSEKLVWVVTSTFYDDWLLEVFASEDLAYQWMRKDILKNSYQLNDSRLEKAHSNLITKLTKDDLEIFTNDELLCYSYYNIQQKKIIGPGEEK